MLTVKHARNYCVIAYFSARTAVAPADLYKSFKTVAKMEKDFFDVWHENPGYPVVEVKKNGTKFTLTQVSSQNESVYSKLK